jgi:hypothetical protein
MRRLALLLIAPLILSACVDPDPDVDVDSEPDAEALDEDTGAIAAPAPVVVEGGFATPESVLHDDVADVYLVSNIDGSPLEADDNGFISRVNPEGDIAELRWIDGADADVTLNAPKGMAIVGDTLYVADIDCVRLFVRSTGAPAGDICIEDALFLNDIAADANGVLYVTDTGMRAGAEGLEPAGGGAVYRFTPDGRHAALARGDDLGNPNGIAFGERGGFVVTFGTGEIYQLGADGGRTAVLPAAEGRQLDGIVFTGDGGFLFSSWGDRAVHHVGPDGTVTRVLEDVESPADIGWDAQRRRVLVPLFMADRVLIQEVPAG